MSSLLNRPGGAGLTGHATLDNIDYNDLKHEIKRRTTRGSGQAQAIPGSDNEANALRKFEDEIYAELQDQHARVDLFVRSKSDATSRQLSRAIPLLCLDWLAET